jgi:hypothetical protein
MIDICKNNNKIPVFYSYIIAFEARKSAGLQDCNVDPNHNLCYHGSQYIRDNRQLLVSRYTHQASKISERLGRDKPAIFLIEPDFWYILHLFELINFVLLIIFFIERQYYGDGRQVNGGLSGEYMRDLLNAFVGQIKQYLPNALISWDISAWIGEDGFRQW